MTTKDVPSLRKRAKVDYVATKILSFGATEKGIGKGPSKPEKAYLEEGRMVWGVFGKGRWWPAVVVSGRSVGKGDRSGWVWLYWLSDRRVSQLLGERSELEVPASNDLQQWALTEGLDILTSELVNTSNDFHFPEYIIEDLQKISRWLDPDGNTISVSKTETLHKSDKSVSKRDNQIVQQVAVNSLDPNLKENNLSGDCKDLDYLTSGARRKLRVLSLFDGIGTGRLALDLLGLDVELYVASEINPDAMAVSSYHHNVTQLGDVWGINKDKLRELCPIDLVLGGPPCNDLSIVNPLRKGFNGSGILVVRFVSLLRDVEALCKGSNHVFWLMENTAHMPNQYKEMVCHIIGMEPAIWDAKHFTGQRRARCFWGNLPGMYRLFGFPTHYTDVAVGSRNGSTRSAEARPEKSVVDTRPLVKSVAETRPDVKSFTEVRPLANSFAETLPLVKSVLDGLLNVEGMYPVLDISMDDNSAYLHVIWKGFASPEQKFIAVDTETTVPFCHVHQRLITQIEQVVLGRTSPSCQSEARYKSHTSLYQACGDISGPRICALLQLQIKVPSQTNITFTTEYLSLVADQASLGGGCS
ncbi:DNM3A-like protein [Mya arenaria]|uniref:DNA (cytosine-5-)-methyltransferase n=1 Tax=Mya arenaria TaxID=6604 RepID=A0ABY7E6H2_MYAAR|nr:DNM3A-like protein [Mya arenaria]